MAAGLCSRRTCGVQRRWEEMCVFWAGRAGLWLAAEWKEFCLSERWKPFLSDCYLTERNSNFEYEIRIFHMWHSYRKSFQLLPPARLELKFLVSSYILMLNLCNLVLTQSLSDLPTLLCYTSHPPKGENRPQHLWILYMPFYPRDREVQLFAGLQYVCWDWCSA